MEERSPAKSPKTGTFEELEAVANRQLLTCRSLARAVSSTVAVLSEAGSGLQRGSSAVDGDTPGGGCAGTLLEARLQEEDALTAGAGRVLVNACGSLGVALVSLAATLSGDVITPLEDMQNVIEIDRRRSRAELVRLQQQAKMCSNAVSETRLRKEKALEELQSALAQSQAAGEASKASQGGGAAWLRAPWTGSAVRSTETAAAAESKIMQAASMQTAIAEELGLREDAETEARLRAEAGSREFQLRLRCVDFARKSLLQGLLGRCAAAWEDAAHALQVVAEQFRIKAGELSKRKPRMPISTSSMPDWVTKAAAAAAADEEKRQHIFAKSSEEVISSARICKKEGSEAENGEHSLPVKVVETAAPEDEAATEKMEEKGREKPEASVEAVHMQTLDQDNAAGLPGSKEWVAKELERIEARDLELRQRESALQTIQDSLEEQQAVLLERRRTLARDQALSMSMQEQETPASGQVFAIDKSPSAKNSTLQHGESGGSAGNQGRVDCENSIEEDEEDEEDQDEDEQVDSVWHMDWARLPSSPDNTNSTFDLVAPAVESTTDQVHSEAAPANPVAPSNGSTAVVTEEMPPAGSPNRNLSPPSATDDKSTDASELQRKLEERRRRSDENDVKENGASKESPTAAGVRKIDKGRMPGVHPKMAEKLEERRRRLDAEELAGGTQLAGTSAPGTA